ncbi:MAG TPA: extracellular solute-binding protein [Solirubrobacteraceae bacterium]|nr:extracellular solute-binding protein [Solirubrobacteraceae bacterium]
MRRSIPAAALLLSLVALGAGCGTPGGDDSDTAEKADKEAAKTVAKPDVAAAGDVTLTVWDQEVRGGQEAQIKRLNEAFQQKYPNVTIKRVAKSFEDLTKTLKLAVSGAKAPDVVQANQGRPVMGQLVKGGLLRPLDAYAEAYGWADRYSKVLLDLNRFSDDAAEFGSGGLYGLSQMGEIVGVYYNREQVPDPPATFEEFEAQLERAKADGDVAIAFGNLEKWPGIHEFETLQAQYAEPDAVRDFVFAREGATFASPENEQAAETIRRWAENGYFTPDFNGTGYDPAWQQFTRGKGRFLIAGTWLIADLADAMGDKVGFMLMPPPEAGAPPVSLGGESLPFAITSKSQNPDVAAAYIDFLTNADAGRVLADTGNLPAMETDAQPAGALARDVHEAWRTLTEQEGMIPYLDYATPTFYDEITAAIQRLLAGKLEPQQFTRDVQDGYAKFTEQG